MKRLVGLGIVSLILSATALGCADSEPSTTDQSAAAGGISKATCTLVGKRKAQVTLEYGDSGFDLTFIGQPVPRRGTALYSATVFDESGEYGDQLGMKFLNGKQVAYFVFSVDTSEQTNLDGAATVNGDTVSGTFPAGDLGQLADAGPASWSAAFNVEGSDVGECPGGIDSLPFPD